ncbi:MAG: ATP-dependent helicase, RecQ family [Chthonomonadaceae bacterium]|nr:ATP-dependent helicase, RecQ family [Chthonomonadaceae bacterium]
MLAGQDTLGVLPTGAGKSLCYQLPALLLPRPTLVISPLIALMKDQLDGLPPSLYPQSTLLNSSLDRDEVAQRTEAIRAGEIRLIYAAPERLRQESFLRLLEEVGLSLVVVDEAHCVSVWGHDFRPDYLFIRKALERFDPVEPVDADDPEGSPMPDAAVRPVLLALTATATPEMQGEIGRQLGRELEPVIAPAFRPNLHFEAIPCANADAKMQRLADLCREIPGSVIVYANSRDRCERLADFLRRQRLPAAHYHAGMERDERQAAQESFMLDRTRIIVATVAFGMGVDKPNVRLVVHFTLPESLESYTQEAGRAGRDGKTARCVLLYAASDKTTLSRWKRQEEVKLETVRDVYRALQAALGKGSGPVAPEALEAIVTGDGEPDPGAGSKMRVAISLLERVGLVRRTADFGRDMRITMLRAPTDARAELDRLLAARQVHADARLSEVLAFAEGSGCRHVVLSQHFGQELDPCEIACDNCLGVEREAPAARALPPSADRVPDFGQAILATVRSLPYPLGRTGLAKVLTGAADSSVGKDRCAEFGLLAGMTLKSIREHTDALVQRGLLAMTTDTEYPLLRLTTAGKDALQTGESLLPNLLKAVVSKPARASSLSGSTNRTETVAASLTEDEDDRYERLRAWRRLEAQRAQLPPYIIFSDATLRGIAQLNPGTREALQSVSGIGPAKIASYGDAVIELLHGD